MDVFIVFDAERYNRGDGVLEVVGVFSDEEKAVAACHSEWCGFGKLPLDHVAPRDATKWPGTFRYPLAVVEEPN